MSWNRTSTGIWKSGGPASKSCFRSRSFMADFKLAKLLRDVDLTATLRRPAHESDAVEGRCSNHPTLGRPRPVAAPLARLPRRWKVEQSRRASRCAKLRHTADLPRQLRGVRLPHTCSKRLGDRRHRSRLAGVRGGAGRSTE